MLKQIKYLAMSAISISNIKRTLKLSWLNTFAIIESAKVKNIAKDAIEFLSVAKWAVELGDKRGYNPSQSINFAFNAIQRCDIHSFEALGLNGVNGGCDGKKEWKRLTENKTKKKL